MKNLWFLLFPISLFACSQLSSEMDMATVDQKMTAPVRYDTQAENTTVSSTAESTSTANGQGPGNISDRKIIKTANLKYQVSDLEKVTGQVDSLSQGYGGYVASMNQNNDHYTFHNQLVIKIPAQHFSTVLQELDSRSIYMDHKEINAQDVSEEFVDISARLATKKAVRDRFTEVLRSKAKNVEDILHAENQIRVIQEEIESIEHRIKYLSNQSAMSTINLEIYQKVEFVKAPEVYEKTYFAKLGESFAIGGKILEKLSLMLIALWPLLLMGIPLYIFRKNIFFKRKNRTPA